MAEDTRERILQTAIQLFKEKGYHGVSVDEIIQESRTSKGGFYHIFKSKEELLFTIHDQYIQYALNAGYECYRKWNTSVERLAGMIRDLLVGIDKYLNSVTIFFQEYRYLTGEYYRKVEEKRDEYARLMVKILEEGLEAGEIRSELPPKILSLAIFGMIDWTYVWFRKEGKYSVDEIADIFIDIILQSILKDEVKNTAAVATFFLKNKM